MYYAITLTWGGGTQDTECDHLQHTIHRKGEHYVFILNGLLSFAMTYVKTQHLQSHGQLIVHTPCHSVSHLIIFTLSVLYPIMAKLSCLVMNLPKAHTYLSYLFVHHGVVLSSKTMKVT
ncbi:hypothetical protein J3R83DRAFT_8782 [Lanmaoa asiatica]|nr:hypothetical protein J3R83DRAFT_8782 [Lanmaoa asiatica]